MLILAPRNETSRWQLRSMAQLAREAGLDGALARAAARRGRDRPYGRSLTGDLVGVERLVLGDPFSGVMQVVAALSKVVEVVVVDDGTATLEFARQWSSGEHLRRWHQVATTEQQRQITRFARDQIADSLRRRLAPGSGCRLTVFSCLPVELRARAGRPQHLRLAAAPGIRGHA